MVTIMLDINTLINELPEMLSGTKLKEAMQFLPEYDASIIQENDAKRLMKLSDLYTIYVPSQMSAEIYSKLYLGILRSLQKKGTRTAVRQFNQNNKDLKESCKTRLAQQYTGIIGGSDSFTIIGSSGIGKSSAISRAIHLITQNKVIQLDEPYLNILPCVCVQCPFDSSVKGLLLEILRKVDEELDTTYYRNAVRAKATTDMLIGSVSQVCLNHVGLLVVDEIQNVVNSKNGKQLIGSLTQLINNSGISICMVGTPESERFFEQAMQLARRSLGLRYTALAYDDYFYYVCQKLFEYQYVKHPTVINDGIVHWLYEHSAGIISIAVSLIHDAQEIAILDGREILDLTTLNDAYKQRMSLLHDYIKPSITTPQQSSKAKAKKRANKMVEKPVINEDNGVTIQELVKQAKETKKNIIDLLQEHFSVEVIS